MANQSYSPVYDANNNITGYNVVDQSGASKFVANTPPAGGGSSGGSGNSSGGLNALGVVDGPAPAGSQKSANGNYVSPSGIQYTGSPDSSRATRYDVGGGSATDALESTILNNAQPESEADIQARIEAGYAQEIAAIKATYAGIMSGQVAVGQQNAGRTRASAAASGVLGQDIGNSEQASQAATEQQAEATIAAEEAAKEGDVYGQINTQAENEYQTERANFNTAQNNELSYLQTRAKDTQAQVASIAATTDLSKLDQATYDSLYAKAGFDTPDEFNAYYNASRQAALQGVKLVGDSTTGFYMPVVDSSGNVSYKNVIKGKPITGSIGTGGAYIYDPTTGQVQTVQPTVNKIITSGGILYSVNPTTNKATPLTKKSSSTSSKVGWGDDLQSTLAVQSYAEGNADAYNKKYGTSYTPDQLIAAAKSSPDAFLVILNEALGSGVYNPTAVAPVQSDPNAIDTTSLQDSIDNSGSSDTTDTTGTGG